MVVYEVIYHIEISAKSKKDREMKAEQISEMFSKQVHKPVIPIGYQEKDNYKGTDVQGKLI